MRVLALLLTAFYLGLHATAGQASALKRLQAAYQGLRDARGSFTQISSLKELQEEETFQGEFLLKLPGQMLIRYKGAEAQTVLIQEEEILIYQPALKQAFRGRFGPQGYGVVPVALLQGLATLKEHFQVLKEEKGLLLLAPRQPTGTLVSLEVHLAKRGSAFPIKGLVLHDRFSNRVEIRLKDVKVNTGLRAEDFTLTLAPGVRVFEQ
jgi:outer membrane lipoprotein-sorting protein